MPLICYYFDLSFGRHAEGVNYFFFFLHFQDTIGFNQAGLQFLKDKLEAENEVQLFADATANFQTKKRKQKKRADRAILKL